MCGMTGLVSCVVVVYMWDDWLGLFQTNKRRQHILGSMLCGTPPIPERSSPNL